MIELIEGLPDEVVGFEAVGEVTTSDYDRVLTPAVERALARHGKIRLLHVLGERFEGQTAMALWDDAKLGLYVRSYERIAAVTDLEHVRALVNVAAVTLPGEVKVFSNAERAEAESWIAAGLGA